MLLLFDPLAEQLHQPAALVKRGNHRYAQNGVDRQEHQRLTGFRVFSTQIAPTPDEPVCPDDPIIFFAGIGQHRTSTQHAKTHAIQLCLIEQQTCSGAAQPPDGGWLREQRLAHVYGAPPEV